MSCRPTGIGVGDSVAVGAGVGSAVAVGAMIGGAIAVGAMIGGVVAVGTGVGGGVLEVVCIGSGLGAVAAVSRASILWIMVLSWSSAGLGSTSGFPASLHAVPTTKAMMRIARIILIVSSCLFQAHTPQCSKAGVKMQPLASSHWSKPYKCYRRTPPGFRISLAMRILLTSCAPSPMRRTLASRYQRSKGISWVTP